MKKKNKQLLLSLGLLLSVFSFSGWAHPIFDENVDAAKITKKVFPSVVRVEAVNGMRKVATGVVVDKKGHIITTALISPKEEKISVVNFHGDRAEAELLGMDPVTHLAVIKAKSLDWEPIQMGQSEDLSLGSWIGVISVTTESAPAITQGIVSSIGPETLRLNVWLMPGASGSPVVDKNGRMVGLVRGTYSGQVTFSLDPDEINRGLVFSRAEAPSSGLTKAYPIDIVERVSSEIREKGKVERGWLGVSITDNPGGGVTVIMVDPDSPASKSGLRQDDIIEEIDGKPVASAAWLVHEIRMHRPGDKMKMKVERAGEELILTAELEEYSKLKLKEELKAKFPSLFSSPESRPERRALPPGQYLLRSRGDKYIGVSVQEMNPELAEYFGVQEGTGLLVNKITEGGPAAEAGLEVGDVIVEVEGVNIEEYNDLFPLIQAKEEGETIQLKVIRDKKPVVLEIKVAVDPERDFRFFSFFDKRKDNFPENWIQFFMTKKESIKQN